MTEEPPRVQLDDGCHSIGDLLARYRPYLTLLAARKLDASLATRLSASDIVQQTQLEAFRDCEFFRGATREQFMAWLKAILSNNVAEATHRHVLAKKRSVKREQAQTDESRHANEFPGHEESPSAAAMKGESAVKLAIAMDGLSAGQFEAIRLRYIEGHSLSQISETMDRSQTAVAGLLKRGLRELRGLLSKESER